MRYVPEKIGNITITNHYTQIKYLVDKFLNISDIELIDDFDKRTRLMIFRGKLSGCYPENKNINLRLATISTIWKIPDYKKYYDVGLSKLYNSIIVENHIYNKDDDPKNDVELLRKDYPYLTKYIVDVLPINKLLSNYQFVLSIDGYVSAWRLPYELLMGNVVFVLTQYTTWFSDLLMDNINCIKISNINLLHERYMSIYNNIDLCHKISIGANSLGKKLFNKNFIYRRILDSVLLTLS